MARTRNYRDYLLDKLQDPAEAAAYLNAAREDEDPRVFLVALRNVADAQGGMTRLAEETAMSRGTLYRTLSEKGNPRLDSLDAMLGACGLEIAIKPKAVERKPVRRRAKSRGSRRARA